MSYKIGLISLGCDKNTVDSEFMLGLLQKHHHVITNKVDEAEIIIVNTCGFIEAAKQESIDTLLEMARYKKTGKCKFLVATGCLSQRYKEVMLKEIPELDAIIGTGDFDKIDEAIEKLETSKVNMTENSSFIDYDISHRVRIYPYFAFVKIAEGCSKSCSYCAIPNIRGPYRSRKISSIKEEVERLVSQGVKEINLVAQDTTNYGVDIYGKPSLPRLLKELEFIDGDFMIRLLYAYPTNLNSELLDTIMDSNKTAKYLDIPLQHINNRILKLMKRPTNGDFMRRLLDKLRADYPQITLRTTFIVGFPTETETEFREILDFMAYYKFDRVGAFEYSREDGTYAAGLEPQVAKEVKRQRFRRLMEFQRNISRVNNEKLVGTNLRVLTEIYDSQKHIFIGRSEKDAPLVDGVVKFTGECQVGNIYTVKILHAHDYDLRGAVIKS